MIVGSNFVFLGVCILIIAGIFILAWILEKNLCKKRKNFSDTHFISYTAIFACMAAILMTIEIPLFFAPEFYKIDLSEIPILICTFYLGPVSGVAAEFIKVVLKLIIKGSSTAFVGDFANFAIGCSFVLPASIIYHSNPGKQNAILGMAVGTAVLTAFGSAFNGIYLLPKFAQIYGVPLDTLVGMGTAVNGKINSVSTLVFFAVVPFNLLKGTVVSVLTFLLYKRISPILHKGDVKRKSKEK